MRGDWEGRREWWLNPQHTAVGGSELQRTLRNKQEIRYLYLNWVFHFFPPQNLERWAVDTKSSERKADKRVVTHPLVYSNTWKWLWLQIKGTGKPLLYIQSQREVLLPEASQDREKERKDGNHDITDELRVDLWACGVINRAHQSSTRRCFVNTDQCGRAGGVSADTLYVCELAFVQGEAGAHRRRKPRHLLTAQRRTSQEIPHVAVRWVRGRTHFPHQTVFLLHRETVYLPAVFHPTARCLVKLDVFKVRVWGGGGE